jgi:hypothetical protein
VKFIGFAGFGTNVTIDGSAIHEVVSIELTEEGIRILANYLPLDPAHGYVFDRIQEAKNAWVIVRLPRDLGLIQCTGSYHWESFYNSIPPCITLSAGCCCRRFF